MSARTERAKKRPRPDARLAALLVVVACGGAAGPRVSSPMTARDEAVFESAVDYVERPSDLGGAWGRDAEGDLEHRVTAADVVAIGTVRAIRTDADAAGHRTARVVVAIDETVVGEVGSDLSLAVSSSAPGYDSVERHERQLLERRFVVFVKWAAGPERLVVARWHLSPASESIVADVRRIVRTRRSSSSSGN